MVKPLFEADSSLRLVLLVTYGCNLDCRYCCVLKELRGRKNMSEEMLLKSVDFLLTSSRRRLQLHFFGAEPLILPFELYEKALAYARRRAEEAGKELEIIVTTNAALLNERWAGLFRREGVRLEISLDGDAGSHNRNRPQRGGRDSHSLIMERLPLIFAAQIPVWVSMVISPETAGRVPENFLYLADAGFKRIFMMVANCVPWPQEALAELRLGLERVAAAYPRMARERGLTLLNLKDWVWPMRMNTELAVDSDGRVYSACVGYLAQDPKLKERCTLAHIGAVSRSIDDYQPLRLSNTAAMGIVFRESKALHTLPGCVKAGAAMAEFVDRLKRNAIF